MQLGFRSMAEGELDAVLQILRDADEEDGRVFEFLIDERNTVYCADFGGDLVGAAAVRWVPDAAEVQYVAIAENLRGRGLGKALMEALAQEVARRGARLLRVGTDNTSLDNVAFYQKCGFRIDSVYRDYFAYIKPPVKVGGIEIRDMLVLSRELVPSSRRPDGGRE